MYRGTGDHYRDRERQRNDDPPPVRRRSVYSPDLPSRSYRHREADTGRRFRAGFQYRQRNERRFSRFDSRNSPPRRRRRSRNSSGSRTPSPRRHYRNDRGPFRDNRFPQREEADGVGDDSVESQSQGASDRVQTVTTTPSMNFYDGHSSLEGINHPDSNGPLSALTTPVYQNPPLVSDGMNQHLRQPFYHNSNPQHTLIPPDISGHNFYPPPIPIDVRQNSGVPIYENKSKEKQKGPDIDGDVIRKILDNLKTKGVIDKFRKTFLDECDEKPDYIRLSERVGRTVTSFLKTRTWLPEINKNTERQAVRRRILESSYFTRELDEMLDRCFSEAESYFMPAIEECVYEYLGIEKPIKAEGEDEDQADEETAEVGDQVEDDDEEEEKEDSDGEEEGSASRSSGSSYMDVDSTEEESDSEIQVPQYPPNLPPPPPPIGSYYPSLIPTHLGQIPNFNRISHLVPNHPPPPLLRPLGFGRHIPLLANTIMKRNPVENPPLPPTDDEDENPPPPSDEDSSTENGDNSDSDEISVGHASPKRTERSPRPLQVEHNEENSVPLTNNSSSPQTLNETKIPNDKLSASLTSQEVDDTNQQVLLRETSESEESPQPLPPGEEDVELPILSTLKSRAVADAISSLQTQYETEIQNLSQTPPPPQVQLSVPPEAAALSLVPESEMEMISDIQQLPAELDEEIPLPNSEPQKIESMCSVESYQDIPLPEEVEDGELEDEIPLPACAEGREGASVDLDGIEQIPIPPTEEDEEVDDEEDDNSSMYSDYSLDSLPSPLVHSREARIPVPSQDVSQIPLPSGGESLVMGNILCQEDLSPVTSGDLDDISDDSLTSMPLPRPLIILPEKLEDDKIRSAMENESAPVELNPFVVSSILTADENADQESIQQSSRLFKTEDLPLVSHVSRSRDTPEEEPLPISAKESPNQNSSSPYPDVNKTPLSPSLFPVVQEHPLSPKLQETLSAQATVSPRAKASPESHSTPTMEDVSMAVADNFSDLPPSPSPLEIVENSQVDTEMPESNLPSMPPPPPKYATDLVPEDVKDSVFVEDEDDEWESPAFEKFGETSPPRIDKVEQESFENLIHTVSPQKAFPRSTSTSTNKTSGGEKSSRSSSSHRRHHSSSRRSKDSSHSKSESTRAEGKHSKSESKDRSKRDDSKHRKSHKSSHHAHSHSSRTKRIEVEGSSESRESKRDERKDSRRHSRDHKHRHSSSRSKNESSSRRKEESKRDSKSSSSSSPTEDSVKNPSAILELSTETVANSSKTAEEKRPETPGKIPEHTTSVALEQTRDNGVIEPIDELGSSPSEVEMVLDETNVPVVIEECDSGASGVNVGTVYLHGEKIEVLKYLEAIQDLDVKMQYYTKYLDPLLMDEEVSLDSNWDLDCN